MSIETPASLAIAQLQGNSLAGTAMLELLSERIGRSIF